MWLYSVLFIKVSYAIVHQCFLLTLSRKIIVRKPTLQTTNKFFIWKYLDEFHSALRAAAIKVTIQNLDQMKLPTTDIHIFLTTISFNAHTRFYSQLEGIVYEDSIQGDDRLETRIVTSAQIMKQMPSFWTSLHWVYVLTAHVATFNITATN